MFHKTFYERFRKLQSSTRQVHSTVLKFKKLKSLELKAILISCLIQVAAFHSSHAIHIIVYFVFIRTHAETLSV